MHQDKVKLLNSFYTTIDDKEVPLSPSDIVINFFEEFMVFSNMINIIDRVHITRSGKEVIFTLPLNDSNNYINIGADTIYPYAESNFRVYTSVSDNYLSISITKLP